MTLSSFFFLVCFSLSFFLGIMEKRLPVQDMTIDKGAGACGCIWTTRPPIGNETFGCCILGLLSGLVLALGRESIH